jgi:hypothetical protein
MARQGGDAARRVQLDVRLDAHALEVLQLELRRLSRRYGFEVARLKVETVLEENVPGEGEGA